MNITFGIHKGKSIGSLVLKKPDYVHWLLPNVDCGAAMLAAIDEASRLIAIYNAKPIQKPCHGKNCTSQATCCTVYMKNVSTPSWWCDSCDPYQEGASVGKLQLISTYEDALAHIISYCDGRKAPLHALIKILAKAKGLPDRVGEKQVSEFFET